MTTLTTYLVVSFLPHFCLYLHFHVSSFIVLLHLSLHLSSGVLKTKLRSQAWQQTSLLTGHFASFNNDAGAGR